MTKKDNISKLKKKSIQIRKDIIKMLYLARSGHPGGSLSIADILVVLYNNILKFNAKNPKWDKRDKLILSKGHACPALYAILADKGYFKREELWTLRKLGSRLQGHPSIDCPGVETASGSLGQGLSVANGIALVDRLDKKNTRIYCIVGDGETNEGQIWEAAMSAHHYNLDNLCVIIDHNKLQIDGHCCDVKDMKEISKKWESFGFEVIEVDGHDIEKLIEAFDKAKKVKGSPQAIIAHTIKGAGVSFMENQVDWHGVAPKKDEYEKAMQEFDKALTDIK